MEGSIRGGGGMHQIASYIRGNEGIKIFLNFPNLCSGTCQVESCAATTLSVL